MSKENYAVVMLSIVCLSFLSDIVAEEFSDSLAAQMGVYTLGVSTRDLTNNEYKEVREQVPEEILDKYEKEK